MNIKMKRRINANLSKSDESNLQKKIKKMKNYFKEKLILWKKKLKSKKGRKKSKNKNH